MERAINFMRVFGLSVSNGRNESDGTS